MEIEYTALTNNGRARFGTTRVIFDSSTSALDETSTTDIGGDTSAVSCTSSVAGGNVSVNVANAGGSGFTVEVKAIVKLIAR